ncbi:asparagine synthase (glutamine-hydrolyzing) [bacterium]|nr:asparagine synthase (glutamine-hydrolyzing) [bacterium]
MCGICGVLSLDGAPVAAATVEAMAARLRHRGPDGAGQHVDGGIALGHRRLAIVDVAGGAQPMQAGEVWLVANAEIYNHLELRRELEAAGHVFRTRCDTEAILHGYRAWGVDVVERLDGMFAFALWDGACRRLLLARDRFGKKPLYYGEEDGRLLFASEPKAILAARRAAPAVEPEALARYLLLDYVPSPWSIFRGLRRLPAAHRLVAEGGALRLERYWRLPPAGQPIDVDTACAQVREAFERAVRARLMSDDPIGVFLSGGNDSWLVLQAAARAMPEAPPDCFTIGFEDGGWDESEEAARAAAAVGSRHHVRCFRAGDLVDTLERLADQLDEPLADAAVLPTYVLSELAAEHVKVVLSGDGADEMFAGYDSFLADRLDAATRVLDPLKRHAAAWLAARWPVGERHFSTSFRLRQASRALGEPAEVRSLAWAMSHRPSEIRALFPAAPGGDLFAEVRAVDGADAVDRALRVLTAIYLEGDILTKLDRAGMARGLEIRSPFLDRRLAELAARLPSSYKLHGLRRKWILRRALGGRRWVAKHGFWLPVSRWIRHELADWFNELLLDPSSYRDGLLDRGAVERLLRQYRDGATNLYKPLWNLAVLLAWKRRWLATT